MPRKANPNSKSTKESRCACCGAEMSEVADGTLRKGTYTCKDWRLCTRCRKIRITSWYGIIINAARLCGGKLYLLTLDWSDESLLVNILRRMRDHEQHYIALRAEDKIYIFHTDHAEKGKLHSLNELETFDWEKLTWTKIGRKISYRGIFKKIRSEYKLNIEGMELTETISFKTNAPKKEELELWNEARLECNNPMPTTLAEERVSIELIAPVFERKLNENGYKVEKILHPKRYKRINVTWKPVNSQQIWRVPLKRPQFLAL